jgi:dTDP-4-amino-4,6-dideoxygalactose transaminase
LFTYTDSGRNGAILTIAKQNTLLVIEDAAQSHGAFFEDEDQNVVTKEEMQSCSFTLEKFRSME